ncbi:plasmid partitioning protein [Streptomyces sp. ISL-12]|uniref:ParB/RepB/Spo0J family partition protein n=1 Tax=Streptomyces sp. ISL-12 TaxID=2819177 RepID=UPI001BE9A920|nr:ParB/RepB/Spo0J family partition protein [Streptomyces sp. ISL-12]MBT2413777.1 plasmid partitioning protein [Streptomyces sp. ISL-12]
MSVADKLGTGSSFSGARRSRSARGRAKAVTQGDVPAYELVRLHLDEVSPTPLNPRRNFGSDEDKTRFGEELRQAQLAACVAVTRAAYLALWPDHESLIGDAAHVLVNGERRYRSAVHVGLEALDFVVRDDLAADRETFVNHLLKENLEREDFDVIERARGVQELVVVCAETTERGARTRAAEQLGKDRSWVTNQLVLLELPEEVQLMLSSGALPERDGRMLARYARDNPGVDAAALLDHLKASKEAAALAKEAERSQLEALRRNNPGLLSADNKPAELSPATKPVPANGGLGDQAQQTKPGTGLLSVDNKPAQSTAKPPAQRQSTQRTPAPPGSGSSTTSKPNTESSAGTKQGEQPRPLPYDDAHFVVNHLHRKMEPAVFTESARLLLRILREQHPDEYVALVNEITHQEQSV